MRIIPGKTKVGIELFRGITFADMIIGTIGIGLAALIVMSTLPAKYVVLALDIIVTLTLLARVDDEPIYMDVIHIILHLSYRRHFIRDVDDKTLRAIKSRGYDAVAIEQLFGEADHVKQKKAKKDYKKLKKLIEKEDKNDEKLLNSDDITEEQKREILKDQAHRNAELKRRRKLAIEGSRKSSSMDDIIGFTDIKDGFIVYGRGYYGAVLEIDPIEFRFFSNYRRKNSIENSFGAVIRNSSSGEYAMNIVKLERPVYFDSYYEKEKGKLDILRKSYEDGIFTEEEYKSRVAVVLERMDDLERMNKGGKIVTPFYYIVLFDSDIGVLNNRITDSVRDLRAGEMSPHRLDDKELAVFLKYSNSINFDEREIDSIRHEDYAIWAMPENVDINPRTVEIDNIITHNFRISDYPQSVGDSWIAGVMSLPGTKVVVKASPMDRSKAVKTIDFSLQELRGQYRTTGIDSRRIELKRHIDSLDEILSMLQKENEMLMNVSVCVTVYDVVTSRNMNLDVPDDSPLVKVNNAKKNTRRFYRESGIRLNRMDFTQTEAFVASQINGFDPLIKTARAMPSNTLAAMFPWIYAHICDEDGVKVGRAQGVPVFLDFFKRDDERVNSNMVIVGKSGSGKSYATKSFLTNLAADNSKIFILDPENEYSELANNLHGKFINVGNAQYGRLNPFHIMTALDDDDDNETTVSGSYATHLQFLEEFFRQVLSECEKDALEYLNTVIDRLYANMGITAETDLRTLKPEDYPVFDDLYDTILQEFQKTDNTYIRNMLRTLMNYISKFASGGRNANIWNGPSTITTDENFTVFNFQSLLSNRNSSVANAQMLLVLKYIDNEIIKNRDYNLKYGADRKIVVVIDEAHVFIDAKYPAALDFMYQLAKRIRKYNGMQIVITQNIKDFVGSEEIARKSTAIINACQYSFIFSLAPNDMNDLCTLYEKAGGINEREQEKIVTAPRGQVFSIMSPSSRTTFQVTVPKNTVKMFQENGYESHYFKGRSGEKYWNDILSEALVRKDSAIDRVSADTMDGISVRRNNVEFFEVTEQELEEQAKRLGIFKDEETEPEREDVEQPVIPVPNYSADIERLVSEFSNVISTMQNFNYQAIVDKVETLVSSRMASSSAPAPIYVPVQSVAPAAPVAPAVSDILAAVPAPVVQTTESEENDDSSDFSLDDLFGSASSDDSDDDDSATLASLFSDAFLSQGDSTNTNSEDDTLSDDSDFSLGTLLGGLLDDNTSSSGSDNESDFTDSDDIDDEDLNFGDNILADIFDLTSEELEQFGAPSSSSSNDSNTFDFAALLASSLENVEESQPTCLDTMKDNGEMVMDINLDDLVYLLSKMTA